MTPTSRVAAHTHPGNKAAASHTHEVDLTGVATTADIAALMERVNDLEYEGVKQDYRLATLEARAYPSVPPPVDPPPVTPPPATVTARSINELYTALGYDPNTDITLAPGTYSGGLYFDSRFAARTKPCIIRLTGVTLNGGGITFRGGAHDLEILDPTFANWSPNQTGVLMFGGWDEPAAHHITVRKPKILGSVKRTLEANTSEHGVYFSIAQGGIHDVLIEDLDVDATGPMGLASAIHADHGTSTQTAWNITARRTVFRGNGTQGSSVQYPLILWTPSYHDWLFDGATITNANGSAIRVQSTTSRAIVFKDVVSTGSRYPSATSTPGVTFVGCSLR